MPFELFNRVTLLGIAVRNMPHRYGTPVPYGNRIRSLVLSATRQRWQSHLYRSQFKLVLDSATPRDARSSWPSWLSYIPRWYTRPKTVGHPSQY